MTEAENSDVVTEAVAPAEEVSTEHEVYQSQESESPSDKELNFAAMRESNARLQAQLEEEKRNREYFQKFVEEKFISAEKAKEPVPEPDELDDLAEDDWTTKRHVTRLAEKQAKAIVQQQLAEWQAKRDNEELPTKIKSQHPDFESVVNKENMEFLKANKPHIVATLAATKDPYAQALAAYDAIKAYGPSDQVREDTEKMERNAVKPGTLGAAKSPSPLSEAKALDRKLSADMKRQYQQEMIAAMRGG